MRSKRSELDGSSAKQLAWCSCTCVCPAAVFRRVAVGPCWCVGKGGRTERVELLARVVDQLLMDLYAVVQRVGAGELGDERREVCEMGP